MARRIITVDANEAVASVAHRTNEVMAMVTAIRCHCDERYDGGRGG